MPPLPVVFAVWEPPDDELVELPPVVGAVFVAAPPLAVLFVPTYHGAAPCALPLLAEPPVDVTVPPVAEPPLTVAVPLEAVPVWVTVALFFAFCFSKQAGSRTAEEFSPQLLTSPPTLPIPPASAPDERASAAATAARVAPSNRTLGCKTCSFFSNTWTAGACPRTAGTPSAGGVEALGGGPTQAR